MKKFSIFLALIVLFSCSEDKDGKNPTDVFKINLSNESLLLEIGKTHTLETIIEPNEAISALLTWSTGDAEIATVENGVVTAVAVGNTEITVVAPNGVKAICSVEVQDGEVTLQPIAFTGYSTKVTFKEFKNNLYVWNILIADEEAYNSYETNLGLYYDKGNLLEMTLYSSTATFIQGIPLGDITLVKADGVITNQNAIIKHSRIIGAGDADRFDVVFRAGLLNLTKSGDTYKFALNIQSSASELVTDINVDTKNSDTYKLYNDAYASTLSEPLIRTTEFVKAVIYRSDPYFYEITLITDGVTIDNGGGQIQGNGEYLHLWLSVDSNVSNPNGEFQLKSGKEGVETFMHPGSIGFGGNLEGSWWGKIADKTDVNGDKYTETISRAPLKKGDVTVNVEGLILEINRRLSITVNSEDDAIPTPIDINISVNDIECIYNDPFETGDLHNAGVIFSGIYGYDLTGGFWYNSGVYGDNVGVTDNPNNNNWTILMDLNDLKESNGQNGRRLKIDMMNLPSTIFKNGTPEGLFTVETNGPSYNAGTIHLAEAWNFVEGNSDPEHNTPIVSGTVQVVNLNDELKRFEIKVDLVDKNGAVIKGTYKGNPSLSNQASPPMRSRVFNPDGAFVEGIYVEERNGRTNWGIELYEKDIREGVDYGTGLVLSLDIMCPSGQTLDKGLPVGTFELYDEDTDMASRYGLINNNFTFYNYVYQGAGGTSDDRKAWTEGNVVIKKNEGENNYTIIIDLHSKATSTDGSESVDFAITGTYTGVVSLATINSMSQNFYLKKNN